MTQGPDGKAEWGRLLGLQGTSHPTGFRGDASLQPWPEWGTGASEGEAATLGPRGWRCPLQTNRKRVSESPRGIGQRGGQAQTPGLCQASFLPSTLAEHPAGCRPDPWARGSSAACSQVRGLALGRHPTLLQGSSKDKEKESPKSSRATQESSVIRDFAAERATPAVRCGQQAGPWVLAGPVTASWPSGAASELFCTGG